MLVCLCQDKTKLAKELKRERIMKENEKMRDEFMTSLKHLRDMYENGNIVMNPQVMEKFKEYISEKSLLDALG